jgi:hypothetical protein
MIGAEEC